MVTITMILVQLFWVHPAAEPLSRTLGALTLTSGPSGDPQGGSPTPTGATRRGEQAPDSGPAPENPPVGPEKVQPRPGPQLEHLKVRSAALVSRWRLALPGPRTVCVPLQMAALLPPDRAKTFLLLMSTPGHSFSLADVLEAVQLNRDLPSALKFLSHSCPICQEQVSFSQVSAPPTPPRWPPPVLRRPSPSLFVLPVGHHDDSLLLLPVSHLF